MFLRIGKRIVNDRHIVRAEWDTSITQYRLFLTEINGLGAGVVFDTHGLEAEATEAWLASEAIDVVAVLTQAQAHEEALERRHESIGDVLYSGED